MESERHIEMRWRARQRSSISHVNGDLRQDLPLPRQQKGIHVVERGGGVASIHMHRSTLKNPHPPHMFGRPSPTDILFTQIPD